MEVVINNTIVVDVDEPPGVSYLLSSDDDDDNNRYHYGWCIFYDADKVDAAGGRMGSFCRELDPKDKGTFQETLAKRVYVANLPCRRCNENQHGADVLWPESVSQIVVDDAYLFWFKFPYECNC